MTTNRSYRDRGFTLVEAVICVSLMGLLATVVSAAIVVSLRSSPAVADRADAAVNVQGLVTWLPQDVDSAKPGSFDTNSMATTGCTGTGTDAGANLLKITWSETITSTIDYVASYRYVTDPDGGHIERVYCTVGAARKVLKVSGLIPPWVVGSEPVTITLQDLNADSLNDTATFEIEPIVGQTIVIKATTKNPNETLPTPPPPPPTPPPPPAPVNQPPVADDIAYTINAATPVPITVTATDPDTGALTASFPAVPPGWSIASSGPMSFNVTAPNTAANTTMVVSFRVTDPAGAFDDANVTFTVGPSGANVAPVANPSSGSTTAGASVVVPLAASDPDVGALTAVVSSAPAGWTATVAGLNVTITVPTNAVVGAFTMNYTVTDPGGATASSTITVNVTGPPPCVINTPAVTPGTMKVKKNNPDALTNTVTVSITIVSGYCVGLALHYDTGAPNGQYVRNFGDTGTTRTVTLPKHPSSELWSVGTKTLQVKDSSATVIGSSTLVVTL